MFYLIANYIIVFLSSFIGGYNISWKTSSIGYYVRFLFPLLFLCVILGCRFGWATDYPGYLITYQFDMDDNYELLFQGINTILHFFNAYFPVAFFIYALVCYIGVIALFDKFKDVAYLAFPIFMCLYFYQSSNLIRYSVAIGFVLFAIRNLITENKNYVAFGIFSICSVLTHTGTILLILILLLVLYMKKLEDVHVTIPLFVVSCFLSADFFTSVITDVIEALTSYASILGDLSVARYLENDQIKEKYFEEVRFETFYNRGKAFYVYLFQIIYMFTVIYCGNIINKKYAICGFNFIYRVSVLASILYIPFYGNELMMRICSFLMALSAIVVAYSIVQFNSVKLRSFRICVSLMVVSFFYSYIYMVLKGLSTNFSIRFIWDMIFTPPPMVN